jgi:chitinase
VTVTVQRVGGSTGAASVQIRTRNGTAKSPADFVAKDETLTWAHGDASPRTVAIALTGDAVKESAENFQVELVAAAGAPVGTVGNAVVTVTEGQGAAAGVGAGLLGLASTAAGVEESAKTVSLRVERTGGGTGAVTVVWRTVDASAKAGGDYVVARGVLRWAAGDVAPKTLSVRLLDDKVAEGPESFLVKLLRATGGARLGGIAATAVKIQDND